MKTASLMTKDSEIDVVLGNYIFSENPREEAFGSLKYLYTDLTDIRKYYIRLGFHLMEFKNCEYYKDFGYLTFEEFCDVNLSMDKGAVSRCINVYRQFNASNDVTFHGANKTVGCAMDLSERWKDYSYTQLCEMLPLSEEERKKVTPDMTVKDIREFKKTLKTGNASVASTQPETSEKEAAKQKKIFDYGKYLKTNGIVRQSYIKSCTALKTVSIDIFDNRGRSILGNRWAFVLEQAGGRLTIRMCDSFDSASYIPNKEEDDAHT